MKKVFTKNYIWITLVVLFTYFGNATNDTLLIRKFVDSVSLLSNGEFVKVNEERFLSNIIVLKKYPKCELLYKQYGYLATKYVRNGNKIKARLYLDTCYSFAKSLTNKQFFAEIKFSEGIYLKYEGHSSLALQNWFEAIEIFKHLNLKNKQLIIVAEDDGVGITSSNFESGMGLLNMKARIHQLNGQIRFDNAESNKGLLTTIKIPV